MVDYAFGHGNDELQRLQHQARVLEPVSLRLFGEMGLKPGMRVLDLGCGAGDLTMLAARQVGRRGSVEGIDENPEAVLLATRRAAQGKLKNVRFHTSTIDAFSTQAPYDAVIGRYILLHQHDPVAFLRKMAELTRPGGLLGLHELLVLEPLAQSFPTVPAWDRIGKWVLGALGAATPSPGAATRLVQHFAEAGLPRPELFCECLIGGGEHSPLYRWAVEGAGGVLPHLVRLGIVKPDEVDLSTLAEQLRREASQANAQLLGPLQVGAWARTGSRA